MKLKSLYRFNLGNTIYNNIINVGSFDGKTQSLIYAISGGKVVIFTPQEMLNEVDNSFIPKRSKNKDTVLNLNREITSIGVSPGEFNNNKSYLYIGSPSLIMCYDVLENKTLFDKDVNDGVYSMISGTFSTFSMPLTIVGGNCSIQGFDITGEEQFWTVTGGNNISMALNDVDDDSYKELIVGTDEFKIRYIKKEQNIHEIEENNTVILIHSISNSKFIYGLENGTIGLRHREKKIWFKKEIGKLTSVVTCDINKDNREEVICGWSNGKLQIRDEDSGEIIEEIEFPNLIICKIFYEKFSLQETHLMICLNNGEIIGYDNEETERFEKSDKNDGGYSDELESYQRMLNEKKSLIGQIENLAIQISNKKKINLSRDDACMPRDIKVTIDLQSNNDDKCADLIVLVNKGVRIKQVILLSDQLYEGGSYVQDPIEESNKMIIQIKHQKDMMVNLHIKVLIGISLFAKDFQVFEFSKVIPKYCFYILLRDPEDYQDELTQGIIYNSTAKLERLILWLVDNFNIPRSELETFIKSDKAYCIRFLSLRTDKKLEIYMKETEIGILTDEIELAGNIFQDLCVFNNVQNQNTTVNYKEYINELSVLLKRVEKLDSARNQYNINMSEIIGQIKDLYVRAEDSRILEDLNTFRKYFVRINLKNVEILDEFEKRSSTYSSLISDMKKINNIIQLFANLKYGQFNNKVIAQSRQCLKEKKYSLLLKVVKTVE